MSAKTSTYRLTERFAKLTTEQQLAHIAKAFPEDGAALAADLRALNRAVAEKFWRDRMTAIRNGTETYHGLKGREPREGGVV